MSIFKYDLGDKVKDQVSGFDGIIVARTEFLNGCIRYSIKPDKLNKDGEPMNSNSFDEQELEMVVAQAVKISRVSEQTGRAPGGERPDVTTREMPSRRDHE